MSASFDASSSTTAAALMPRRYLGFRLILAAPFIARCRRRRISAPCPALSVSESVAGRLSARLHAAAARAA